MSVLVGRPSRLSLGLLGLCLLVVMVRVGLSGMDSLERGQEAIEEGEVLAGTALLRESLGWYLPVAPWRSEAADGLWRLHEKQVAAGDLPGAVQSLSALRSGVLSTWGLVYGDQDLLERVHGVLPGLMAQWEAEAAGQEGRAIPGDLPAREAHYRAVLLDDVRPHRGWGVLAIIGFGAWLVFAFLAASRQGGGRGRFLAASAVGLVAMLLGLYLA